MSAEFPAMLALAVEVAQEAGQLVRERRDAVDRIAVTATKSTPTDVVTESDTASATWKEKHDRSS